MLKLQHISKFFAGVASLQDVSLEVGKAEVHAICGENGAGKSTLMNIISGRFRPDQGKIYFEDKPVEFKNVAQAQATGIGIVHQERSLAEHVSVAENIFVSNKPVNSLGFIDYKSLYEQTDFLLESLEIQSFNSRTIVKDLSAGQRQLVEIAKALSKKPKLLILDEPTASISEKETEVLFRLIENLKRQGVSVIYISHRMKEIKSIADKVSILKDGCYQKTVNAKEVSIEEIIKLMVGRELATEVFQNYATNEVVLEVRDFSGPGFSNINFTLHKGEILGFAGLVGAGRTEVAKAIFGAEKKLSGAIIKNGSALTVLHPAEAFQAGIAYLPEERKALGSFQEMTLLENMMAANLKGFSKMGLIQERAAQEELTPYYEGMKVKATSVFDKMKNLSGGNQQKIVLSKCLLSHPDVLIADEPTHGVDIGAKVDIYRILKNMAAEGMAIILISSELTELLLLADNILVMHEGKQKIVIPKEKASEELIMRYAAGTS